MIRAKSLLIAALAGLVLAAAPVAPAVAADSDNLTREELQAKVRDLQTRVAQAQDLVERANANRESAVATSQQLERAMRELTDRYMIEKAAMRREIDGLRKARESWQMPPGLTGTPFPLPGFELVTIPVTADQPVKYWDSMDVKGVFPAGPDAKEKTRVVTVIPLASVVAINGAMASPEPGVKVETIQVMLPKDDAWKVPLLVKLVVGGKFTLSPPQMPRLTPEALDLLAKDLQDLKAELSKAQPPVIDPPRMGKVERDPALPPAPVRVFGHIKQVDNDAKVAAIDVGSADGVVNGMTFIVFDGAPQRYLATLSIKKVAEKTAAGDLSTVRQTVRVGCAVTIKTAD